MTDVADNSRLTSFAKRLRAEQTDAEAKLWQAIRANQVFGAKFRRQTTIPPYIVDFCCEAEKLIVEVDGSQHVENAEEDKNRTQFLNRRGYEVIRFDNVEVLTNLDGVLEVIGKKISTDVE
jgi:very-short-patch-repair endonuclease